MHLIKQFCHWRKPFWNYCFIILLCLFYFCWISKLSLNFLPLSLNFSLGIKKESLGARSGEYGGGIMAMLFLARYCTERVVWAGPLAWCSSHHQKACHFPGCFSLTAPAGTVGHLCRSAGWQFDSVGQTQVKWHRQYKKMIKMLLTLKWTCLAFFGCWDEELFHQEEFCFVFRSCP
jgi:hypothetical protein